MCSSFLLSCGWERKVQGGRESFRGGVGVGSGERERDGRFVVERVLGSSMGGG